MESRTMNFKHCVIEGTPYEAGKLLGSMICEEKEFIEFMTSPFMGGSKLTSEQLMNVKLLFDTLSPGLNDEMKGFADAVGANVDDVVYYFVFLHKVSCTCSQIAITSEMSVDGKAYLARNYDFNWYDRPMLMETHIQGQYRQIGFGCQLFGRFDGMNEHGLCVTTSAGVIGPNYEEEGFVFPFIVRTILSFCKDVEEALALMEKIPMADYRNYILMDAAGNTALVEEIGSKRFVKQAGKNYADQCLWATNHYNLPQSKALNYPVTKHSVQRDHNIEKYISEHKEHMGKEELRELLATPMPEGVCCHYYEDGLGTLWSMIFDPVKRVVEICFGTPSVNPWRTYQLNSNVGDQTYSATLPNETAPEGFWNCI